jgi:hypothetical protein
MVGLAELNVQFQRGVLMILLFGPDLTLRLTHRTVSAASA